MKEVRWGIIGCGEVTEKKSGPAFNEVEGSHVEAVFSRNETKARSYAERHHVRKWYTDPQELILDPDINAIYVATPPAAHTTFAIMSMRAGKPCYVEKPLAASYEDCIRINHISEQTGVRCYVAYYRRYLPYFKKVKTLINSGVLGKIMTVQVRLIAPPKPQDAQTGSLPWRLQSSISGGGYFYDLAPHQIDLLQDYFGIITKAHGYKANRGGLYAVEDTVNAVMEFESGLTASGAWCFCAHESGRDDRIEVFGSRGAWPSRSSLPSPSTSTPTRACRRLTFPARPWSNCRSSAASSKTSRALAPATVTASAPHPPTGPWTASSASSNPPPTFLPHHEPATHHSPPLPPAPPRHHCRQGDRPIVGCRHAL